MTTIQWVLSFVLAMFGAYIWVLNLVVLSLLIRFPSQRGPSMTPVVGGTAFAFALAVCPLPGVAAKAWLPFVIDIVLYLLCCGLAHLFVVKIRGK